MKKLLVLSLIIILPFMAIAQKRQNKTVPVTVKQFFDKYSEYPGYECLEVNEQMFKQFLKSDGLDQDMTNFLSSLKHIRYLEYKQPQGISFTSHVDSLSSQSPQWGTNIVYVDGVRRVRSTSNISKNARDSIKVVDGSLSSSTKAVGHSTLSVSSSVAGVSLSDSQSSILSSSSNMLFSRAKSEIDFHKFTQLMKANQNGEKLLFLKRDAGNGFTEYILLTGNTMINIMGNLNINHINQIEDILDAVGDILPQ